MAVRVAKIVLTLLLLVMTTQVVYAQYSVRHQAPVAMQRGQSNLLEFAVPGLTQADVQQARLFYRYNGEFTYSQKEADFRNGAFLVPFEVDDKNATTLEYYLEISLLSGEDLYYPESLPSENPIEVEIVSSFEAPQKKRLKGIDYTILAPEAGKGVAKKDVLIAIALFYDIEKIPDGTFKLYLDEEDITGLADTSAYYFSYIPKNLNPGPHRVALEYETESAIYAVANWDFAVVAPGQASFQGFEQSRLPQVNVELTARNQVIAGDLNNAYTGRTSVAGRYGRLRYSLTGYLTSQESMRLQPQNRYKVNLALGKWWNFEAGHVYPTMSPFTISGRRVHGINTSVHLLKENLNMQFIYGELERSITNQYDSLVVRNITNSADSVVDKSYQLTYRNGGRGTFKRKITGGRIAFGNKEHFQLGFQALKIQDDTTSIFNPRDYLDLNGVNLNLNSNLSPSERDSLMAKPDLLEVKGGSVKPRENVVVGTNLNMGFLNNSLRFESEAVVSALNNNIYGGPLSTERAEDLGFDIDKSTADLLERLSWLIIINENMNVLPLNISEDNNGDLKANPFFPTGILAGNSQLSYRNSRNNFQLRYRWIGPNFNSLANTTIRRDIAGFTLSDRFNLLENRVYITLGFESLKDNVTGIRDATTQTTTYRTNVSWYPVDRSLPRVSAGVHFRMRDNGIKRENYLLSEELVHAAVQNIRQELRTINGQDSLVTITTATPRRNETFSINGSIAQQFMALDARNDISLSLSNLKTTDRVFAYGDVQSTALTLNLRSRFNGMPLESQLGFTYNNTDAGSGQTSIQIAGFYVGGTVSLLENRRLMLNGRVAITNNNTSSRMLLVRDNAINDQLNDNPRDNYYILSDNERKNQFQTYVVQAGLRYTIDDYSSLVFDTNLTNVSGSGRANDHVIQFRYIFSF
jgi:hypothetical protein